MTEDRLSRNGSSAPLPGDCVPIPQLRTDVRDGRDETVAFAVTHVVPGLDLDGLGSPVFLVPPDRPSIAATAMHWRLFIQRGACGHELGLVIGMDDPVAEPDTFNGLRNFSVVEALPADLPDGQGVGVTVYTFDGERYTGGRTDVR